jgi:catechol 2,3-dioxygenase-like lactoylglutathione lyase family enzyme
MINHIAVSVPDLEQDIIWYKEVFGLTIIKGPVEFVDDDSLRGRAVRDIHSPDFKQM